MTNFEKLKEMIVVEDVSRFNPLCEAVWKLRGEENCDKFTCRECREWLKQEYKPQILDKAEKKYLGNIIRPFRDKVNYITKKIDGNKCEYITIVLHKCMGIFLPSFEGGTMYKGMELNKKYNLKELGL